MNDFSLELRKIQIQNSKAREKILIVFLGMIFSMCALMLRIKWAAWVAIYCSCISFANTKFNDDTKQIMSSFMLSISAVVMSYLQNPAPMTLPGSA